jgi:sugar/nucleoside kinase (ribokinase family)
MKPVLGLGHALVDILVQMKDDSLINELGLPKGSMTMIDDKEAEKIAMLLDGKPYPMVSGGSAANTIHGIAKLGGKCGYLGKINKDEFGEFFEKDLKDAGIDTSLLRGKAATGRANTFISADSERTFATYLGAAVEIVPDDITEMLLKKYGVLHIEGYLIYNVGLLNKVLPMAKQMGILVSIDLASYNVVEDNIGFLKEIIPQYVDLVFANEEEAKAYTGKEPEGALDEIAGQCEIAIVKVGKNGSLIKSKGNKYTVGVIESVPLDTTGAGDQYAAGFIYGLDLGVSLDKCGELGALLAGKVIEKYGARIPEEDWPAILQRATEITQLK